MEPEDVLHVLEWEKLAILCAVYAMEAENVGTAVEQENAQNAEAQVE
jgi:hypothetical protein